MFQNMKSSNRKKQVILLMISNRKTMALSCNKNLSALFGEITSKNDSDIYCLNYSHSIKTKDKLNHIKKYEKIKIYIIYMCLLKTLKY